MTAERRTEREAAPLGVRDWITSERKQRGGGGGGGAWQGLCGRVEFFLSCTVG
jgi:hypothetical protein